MKPKRYTLIDGDGERFTIRAYSRQDAAYAALDLFDATLEGGEDETDSQWETDPADIDATDK